MIDKKKRKEKIARYNLHFCIREEWLKLDTIDIDIFFGVIQMLLKFNKHKIYYGFIKAPFGNKEIEIPRAFSGTLPFFMVERLFNEGIDNIIEKIKEEGESSNIMEERMKDKKAIKKFYKMMEKRHAQLRQDEKKTIKAIEELLTTHSTYADGFGIQEASDLLALAEEKEALNREMEYTTKILQVLGE